MAGTTVKTLLIGTALLANAASAAAEDMEQWLGGDYATGTWGGARTGWKKPASRPRWPIRRI